MRVDLAAAARRDLAGIWRYSVERWDEKQAHRYLRKFAEAFDGIASGAVKVVPPTTSVVASSSILSALT